MVGKSREYTNEELVEYIICWTKEFGCKPVQKDFKECEIVPYPNTYINRFGNWENAVELAMEKM
jgi:hypothetical protein